MTISENWGYIIRRLREERDMTQAELAAKSGLLPSHISRIEAGQYRSPKQETFERLAKGLTLTTTKLSEIIKGKEVPAPQQTLEDVLELARLIQPVAIPVHTVYPVEPDSKPLEVVYRVMDRSRRNQLQAYLMQGSSLEYLGVKEGDILILDRNARLFNGDIVACLVNGILQIGQLKQVNNETWLETREGMINFRECQQTARMIEKITKYYPLGESIA